MMLIITYLSVLYCNGFSLEYLGFVAKKGLKDDKTFLHVTEIWAKRLHMRKTLFYDELWVRWRFGGIVIKVRFIFSLLLRRFVIFQIP